MWPFFKQIAIIFHIYIFNNSITFDPQLSVRSVLNRTIVCLFRYDTALTESLYDWLWDHVRSMVMVLRGLFFDVKKFPGTTCVKNASNFASKCSPMEDNDGEPESFFFWLQLAWSEAGGFHISSPKRESHKKHSKQSRISMSSSSKH